MEPVLFYTPGTCALACMVALEWRRQPYSVCLVTPEERASDRYRAINPRAQVPALRVDGRVLVEVNAILAHVADRAPEAGMLPPNGTDERDVANQWLAYFGSGLHPVFWPHYHPERYARDAAAYESVKGAAVDAIRRELRFVDAHLADRAFVLGSAVSVLDAYLFAMARWGTDMLDLKDFPHVFRHTKQLAADPRVRHGLAIERARELPAPSDALQRRLTLATFEP